MDKRSVSALEGARKDLHRLKRGELTLEVLGRGLDTALRGNDDDLELLSFWIVLLRQLNAALPAPEVVDLVYARVGPALQPRGALGALLLVNLAHTVRPRPVRAAECLSAATKLVAALPALGAAQSSSSAGSSGDAEHPLTAMFVDAASELGRRGSLVAISIMADTVPRSAVPPELLPRLLAEMDEQDGAAVRASAIVALLGRDRAGNTDTERDKAMLAPLIPHLRTAAVTTLSRYLLPALFKAHRYAYDTFLRMLDERAAGDDGYFGAWVTTASYGVSSGFVALSALPHDRLHDALTHATPAIRIMAFELVALSRSVLDRDTMDLVRFALHVNDAIPGAGARTDMVSAVHAFLTHLKALEAVAARDVAKGAKGKPGAAEAAASRLATSAAFHAWFLDDFLAPAIRAYREHPALRSIYALKLLRLYLDVCGDEAHARVYTPQRVADLVACQASEFTEARAQARSIISRAPLPLAGFESLDTPATVALLASARASVNHPRKTQAEAGRAALCIIFTKLVLPAGQAQALSFVGQATDQLERHVASAEADLGTGIVEYPLHGPLSVVVELVRCLDLSTAAEQDAWAPTLHRLLDLVRRVWAATRKVVSLGPSEDGDTAAHEIARAYEVLGDDEDGDDGPDHTNLLSGCWRAVREAGDLLSVIVTVPLAAKKQSVWSRDEVDAVGRMYLSWLHEIRHRGTFSRVAPALGAVVDATRRHEDLAPLVEGWLETELSTVAEGTLSTLRRSAALPYTFLALVSGNQALLDRAVDRLLTMGSVSSSSSDTTKVHAMNTLKIVLLDARQTRLLPRYLERTLTVSLAAFGSANWNVRNVGLILFSTLSNRVLSTSRAQDDNGRAALAARQTLASWHAQYPTLIPYITQYLRHARGTGGPTSHATLGDHSPLFPILIILRSLRWSRDGDELAERLFPAVEAFLGSVEWQVREVASQALSSLLSPQRALDKAKVTATRVSHVSGDMNTVHGRLLFLRRLFTDVVAWDAIEAGDRRTLELRLRDALAMWPPTAHPVIPAAILDCVATYAAAVPDSPLVAHATHAAVTYLRARPAPGADLLHGAAARLLLAHGDVVPLLAPEVPEDAQLAALAYITGVDERCVPALLPSVLRLAEAKATSNAVRTAAFDVIAAWPGTASADIARLAPMLMRYAASARCVPLREAALGALGRAAAAGDLSAGPRSDLAALIEAASDENQSEPRRASALAALEHLAPGLYESGGDAGTRASLLRSALRLLEDDDVDIRSGAAGVVCVAAGRARPLEQGRALALWWSRLDAGADRELWESWLWDLVLPPTTATSTDVALFVEEPPNMFRDPLVSAAYAAEALASLPPVESPARARATALVAAERTPPASTPIDAQWAAASAMARRMAAVRRALGEPTAPSH